jgi:hypothetical protein
MTRIVVDAQTWAKLSDPHELIELCDRSGQTLGYYQPALRVGAVDDNGIHSPYSDEEIDERRRQTGGQPLTDFVRGLSQQ